MANHKSAEKCIRKTERRTAINKNRLSRVRTFLKKAEQALSVTDKTAFDATAAKTALILAEGELMRGAQKGVVHKNTAARKISRLTRRFKALSA